MTKTEARRKIIQTANRYRLHRAQRRTPFFPPTVYSARHIQQAVRVVRFNELVDAETLNVAGFR